MKFNVKKLIKLILILAFITYFVITIYKQQKQLDSYKSSIASLQQEIDEKKADTESLIALKENVNSLEYIEKIAREKLNMYKSNEKVYRDISSSNS